METKYWDIFIETMWDSSHSYPHAYNVYLDSYSVLLKILPDGICYMDDIKNYGKYFVILDPRYDAIELNNEIVNKINELNLTTNLLKI